MFATGTQAQVLADPAAARYACTPGGPAQQQCQHDHSTSGVCDARALMDGVERLIDVRPRHACNPPPCMYTPGDPDALA